MHSQPESAQEHPAGTAPILSAAAGLGLYLMTLAGEAMLGASARWLLLYLGAATVGTFVPLGLSAEAFAWIGALAPLVRSALALALPGRGRIWHRRLGARRPSAEESAAIDDALALLRSIDPGLGQPSIYVLDNPLPAAAVRGRALVLTRAVVESELLAAVLGHELGHLSSLDGRLTDALERLTIWEDPLSPHKDRSGGEGIREFDPDPGGGLLWNCLRWLLCLAGGGTAHRVLAPPWAAYWRTREYAADAHAAALGQAEDLARHLTDFELVLDGPRPGIPFNRFEHPPVALRIDRLHAPQVVSK